MKLVNIKNAILIWGALSSEAIEKLKQEQRIIIVPEHRPFMMGLKYNCPRLRKSEVPFVYCTDNTLGLLFYKNKIKKTIFFYKEKTDKGIVGFSGSLYVIFLSKLHAVPVEIMQGPESIQGNFETDASTFGGKKIILANDKQEYTVPCADELIELEILK